MLATSPRLWALLLGTLLSSCESALHLTRTYQLPTTSFDPRRFERAIDETAPPGTYALLADPAPKQEAPRKPSTEKNTDPNKPEKDPLRLEQVQLSVERHFPFILAALEEVAIAEAKILSSQGAFDLNLKSKAQKDIGGPEDNERANVLFERATPFLGATVLGGYRIGRGEFAEYDAKAETNAGGEFRGGVIVPLLKGRYIDSRRAAYWQSLLSRDKADTKLVKERLSATKKSAQQYWKWVAAGRKRSVARELLDLAKVRQVGVQASVDAGQLEEIALVENRRLIAERTAFLVRAERGLQEAAIALSLFLRDEDGAPLLPSDDQLPLDFPGLRNPNELFRTDDVERALRFRPEVQALEIEREKLRLSLDLAKNSLLPKFELDLLASQDIGGQISSSDSKGPFEFEAGVRFEVPLQRRKARGQVRAAQAEIALLDQQLRLVRDAVTLEVQDVISALRQSYLRVQQVAENQRLAKQLEEAEGVLFEEGQSDLFRLNLREQQTASAASSLIDVLVEHFRALAEYRFVLGATYDEVLSAEGLVPYGR